MGAAALIAAPLLVEAPAAIETQGEAVAYRGYLTVSGGVAQPLSRVTCAPP